MCDVCNVRFNARTGQCEWRSDWWCARIRHGTKRIKRCAAMTAMRATRRPLIRARDKPTTSPPLWVEIFIFYTRCAVVRRCDARTRRSRTTLFPLFRPHAVIKPITERAYQSITLDNWPRRGVATGPVHGCTASVVNRLVGKLVAPLSF